MLNVTEQDLEVDPQLDPDPFSQELRIGSGSVPKCHGSATLLGSDRFGTIRENTGDGTWKQCSESRTFCLSGAGTGFGMHSGAGSGSYIYQIE
jgi:hypothetical protein